MPSTSRFYGKSMGYYPEYDKIKPRQLFKLGTIVEVSVSANMTGAYAPLVGATGYVVEKSKWTNELPSGDFVILKITDAPNDISYKLALHGFIYPVRREWLRSTGKHMCRCDMHTELMRHGCKCGGE